MVVKEEVFTADILKEAVQKGRKLFVFEYSVYDIEKFIKYHPGGILAIEHMLGKDATDAINVFHPPAVLEKSLPRYRIGIYEGRLDELETDYNDVILARISDAQLPEKDDLKEKSYEEKIEIAKGFRKLNAEIRAKGFYQPNYWFYLRRAALFVTLLAAATYTVTSNPSNNWNLIAGALMYGFVWHGLSFSVHDAGHHSLTCNSKADDLIAIFCAAFVGGLSVGWWRFNHNVHHIVTNDPEHDPDIQHLPVFAVSTKFFQNLYSSFYKRVMTFDYPAKLLVSAQHYLYYVIMSFGRFNLYFQSLSYLLDFKSPERKRYRFLELAGIATFWTWFGYYVVYSHIPTLPQALMFLYISHAATFILHVQITLSHFAMSTDTPAYESFFEKGLRTTMNVECPQWFDWFHGGLQFQIEHHLFPRVPRVHFRKLAPLVRKFCEEHKLNYHSYGFLRGNGIVLGALKEVAMHVRLMMNSANPDVRYTSAKIQ